MKSTPTPYDAEIAGLFARFLQSLPATTSADQIETVYYSRAANPQSLQEISAAIANYEKMLPNKASLHLLKGHIALQQNALDQALLAYGAAVNGEQDMLTGDGAESYFAYGVANVFKGDFETACEMFAAVRQVDPNNHQVQRFFESYIQRLRPPVMAPPAVMPPMQTPYSPPATASGIPLVTPSMPQSMPPFVLPTPQPTPAPAVANLPTFAIPKSAAPPPPALAPKFTLPQSNRVSTPGGQPAVTPNPQPGKAPAKEPARDQAKDDGCFIATAAFGTSDAPVVIQFRQFRDQRLRLSWIGRRLIRIYYTVSPSLARFISHRPRAKAMLRSVLRAIAGYLPVSNH